MICAVGRKSYSTGFLVLSYGSITMFAIPIAPKMLSLLRHTPFGMPVLPDVYITTEICSRSSLLSITSSTIRLDSWPSLNKSSHVRIVAFSPAVDSLDSFVILLENTTYFIGFSSPRFLNKLITFLTCLSMPSTNMIEHLIFLIMYSSASKPKLSYSGTVV